MTGRPIRLNHGPADLLNHFGTPKAPEQMVPGSAQGHASAAPEVPAALMLTSSVDRDPAPAQLGRDLVIATHLECSGAGISTESGIQSTCEELLNLFPTRWMAAFVRPNG